MVGIFRRWGVISQRSPLFAANGHFRSPFRSCEKRGAAKWHSCAKGVSQGFSQLRNEAWAAKMSFWGPWWFRRGFRSCEMELVCQRWVSQLRKFSQGVAMGLRNGFTEEGLFRSKPLISKRAPCGCEIILQRMAVFAGIYFGLRNFANNWNFLLLSSF